MSNVALPATGSIVGRFGKWPRIVAIALVALAFLALSFALGRITMGGTTHTTPVSHTAVEPQSHYLPERGCGHAGRC